MDDFELVISSWVQEKLELIHQVSILEVGSLFQYVWYTSY